MAFLDTTTSSLSDLLDKLNTFLGTTVGTWSTFRDAPNGEFAARKTGSGFDIGFACQHDTASPNSLGIYHFHGAAINTGNAMWAQNDDSGNGAASTSEASLALSRRVVIGNTPLRMWVFEDDHYFHAVVQTSTVTYRHFGAGLLTKYNDYTGGEYVYGHRQDNLFSGNNSFIVGNNTYLLSGQLRDTTPGILNAEDYAATIHVEGLDNQPGSGKYAVCMGTQGSTNLGQDRQGTPQDRIHFLGGFGGGPFERALSQYRGTKQRALNPMRPILPFYWNRTTDNIYGPMGEMPDVRGVNIKNFTAGEEVVIGSDTWVLFPISRNDGTDTVSGTTRTGYQGIAYKKVTT